MTTVRPRKVRRSLVRNMDAGGLVQSFLVAAIASLLGLRFYLWVMKYPQVGGDGLHIAHMLWGGLGMLVAIILMFVFLGKRIQQVAAIVGGLGFGIFIDELGKFITSDNNYFFRPTIAIIYIIFMALFLAYRTVERRITLTPEGYLVNALEMLREAALHDLDREERDRALEYLKKADRSNPLVGALEEMLERADLAPERTTGLAVRAARGLRARYYRLVGMRWFDEILIVALVAVAILDIGSLVHIIAADPRFSDENLSLSFTDWGDTVATVAASGMVIFGAIRLRTSRLTAYQWFKRAVLVAIFFSQFFSFYARQLAAISGLAIDILLLAAIEYMIAQEQSVTDEPVAAGVMAPAGD